MVRHWHRKIHRFELLPGVQEAVVPSVPRIYRKFAGSLLLVKGANSIRSVFCETRECLAVSVCMLSVGSGQCGCEIADAYTAKAPQG